MAHSDAPIPISSRTLVVKGQVQGVGFRPCVYRIATSMGLTGSVRNDPSGVTIRLFGPEPRLDEFEVRLAKERPVLCRIEAVSRGPSDPSEAPACFAIAESDHSKAPRGRVTVDAAMCPDCLREMLDPRDRWYRHPMINCTNCGPRYSIVRDLPYDRPLTTMVGFAMCDQCAAEYHNPADRRFHAQPICCPSCGPRVRLLTEIGSEAPGDPIREAARLIDRGGVLAMKGLGGYHLVADARKAAPVERLRRGKKRDHKPFALMAARVEEAERLVTLSDDARRVLASPAAPIILAPRRTGASVADAVAPGLHRLGVMIPHTPMQHLLMLEHSGPLVMTSANLADDPLITDDEDARSQLKSIADAWLVHDRPIQRAVDDSIMLDMPSGLVPIRRARGLVPEPMPLPIGAAVPGLCVGGELKATIAVVPGEVAVLSQHLGDLSHTLAYERFRTTIKDLLALFDVVPAWVARDSHPSYLSHRFAQALAQERRIPVLNIQHHHAHLAALMAEHGVTERIVGIVCDGVGYGEDGTSWGGEIVLADLVACRRIGRMRPLPLPGGDAAARQTGRCALSWLWDAFGPQALDSPMARRVIPDGQQRAAIGAMLAGRLNCPPSSGMGRLFDAAASLLSVCDFNHFEAMSGLRVEALASTAEPADSDENLVPICGDEDMLELDHRPLCRRLVEGIQRGEHPAGLARLFHDAISEALVRTAVTAARKHGATRVGLSGGVFCNAILTDLVSRGIAEAGLRPLIHRQAPPNDGGLALGQAAIAAARLQHSSKGHH